MHIVPASIEGYSKALILLESNNLPINDITTGTQLFVAEENEIVFGTIAVEYDFTDALLRSLCVSDEKRNSGIGIRLVNFIETYVRQQGVENMYLLTTTASRFFKKLGYEEINRESAPLFIRNTSEFSSVCPSTATAMKKKL